MYIALDFFSSIHNAISAVLSVATGVGGCECPISAREFLMNVAFWQFSNNPPNYDSVDDAM